MDDVIMQLLKENNELIKEIHKMTKSIKHYIVWQQVWSVIKLLVIVVPIVLGIIYLPPLIKNLMEQVSSATGMPLESLLKTGAGGMDLKNIDLKNLPAEYQKLLPATK